MSARFMFSSLFPVAGVAAALDALIWRDAQQGRVNREFALLAQHEGVKFDLLKKDGHPINKPSFLKLAAAYRESKGRGFVSGRNKQAAWGAALDCIALGLMLGDGADDAERVQALTDSGQYLGDADAWLAAIPKPVAKVKGDKHAPKVGEPSPVSLDKHAPSVAETQQAGAVTVIQGAEAQALAEAQQGQESPAQAQQVQEPAIVELSAPDVLAACVALLHSGAFTAEELGELSAAVAAAQGAMLAEQAMQAARDKAEAPALA